MAFPNTFSFFFINDTKQGALLSYSRQDAVLDANELCDIFCGGNGYIHFTCKDSNFRKTGDESNAGSIFGIGYFTTVLDGVPQNYAVDRFTYYTNGSVKECYFYISLPGPFEHFKP